MLDAFNHIFTLKIGTFFIIILLDVLAFYDELQNDFAARLNMVKPWTSFVLC